MHAEIKDRIATIRRGEVPKGYTKCREGVRPLNWPTQKIKQWLRLCEREIVLEDEKKYTLLTVRRAFGGVDERGVLLGKNILVKNYFTVNAGDFVISKRQIAHGACGVVGKKLHGAVVSNEYNVFVPHEGTNIHMFALIMQLPYYHRLFYLMSDGVHIEKLLFKTKDWMKRELSMPPLAEQQKIAAILSTCDKLIALKEQRLAAKEQQKKYLMQQLLTGKKRLPGFSVKWKKYELSDIFDYIQPTNYLVTSTNYSNTFSTPVLTAGKTFILGHTDDEHGIYTDVPVVIFDDFTTSSKYVDFSFKAKSSAMKILKAKQGFSVAYAFAAMQQIKYTVGGHERHWISIYSKLPIKAPHLTEQAAIADILTTADKELDLLKQDIEQEKLRKKALMQLLLTGIVRVAA